MSLYHIEADGIDIFDGLGQSVSSHIVGRACLELKGQTLEGGLLPRHLVDHLAPTLIRRQFLQPLLLAIEHTDARRSVHLMTAEGKEIAVHRLHVYLEVRSTLGTVHQDWDAMLVSRLDDFLHGIHRSQDIADMGNADDLRPLRDVCFDVIATNQTSIIRYRQMLHHNPPLHRLQLPGDDI